MGKLMLDLNNFVGKLRALPHLYFRDDDARDDHVKLRLAGLKGDFTRRTPILKEHFTPAAEANWQLFAQNYKNAEEKIVPRFLSHALFGAISEYASAFSMILEVKNKKIHENDFSMEEKQYFYGSLHALSVIIHDTIHNYRLFFLETNDPLEPLEKSLSELENNVLPELGAIMQELTKDIAPYISSLSAFQKRAERDQLPGNCYMKEITAQEWHH